ncbi:ABC transporter family substrate-binding protein [Rhodococcus antarcticus]|uniref:ABC transporter family substrate-binding protein n=1 Tax=Rhodococcus antarcticus TaxID=2987751 RepID=A0ABY6NX06_9NOCA|nr:ABC transporter family substrate-binding protein [Rhodococcus antarcticus]UZJ23900.1 ABC transporter family substrate-binding protein [Rhodococcus antarcticus]
MSLNRRAWRLAAPLAVLALLAGACGSSGSNNSGGAAAAPQTAGQADINPQDVSSLQQGGNFRWAINEIPPNFNYNELDGTLSDNADIINSLYPRPFFFDAAGKPTVFADYFTDVKLTSTDPQVVTYTINPKAKWSDGSAVSWEDFDAQFKALNGTNPAFQVSSSTGYSDIAKVEMGTNAQQAVVTFTNKFSDWQSLFSPLYPKAVNATPDAFNTSLTTSPGVTAGPFKYDSTDQTAKTVTLKPDAAWWGDKPVLGSITYVALDQAAQVQALVNNEIDYTNIGSSVNDNKTARDAQGVSVRQALAPDYRHLTFNGAAGSILSDKDLRVAVMKGINRDGIAQALLNGIAQNPKTLGNHIYVEGLDGYQDNSSVVSYDPDAASKALDALGWVKNGDTRTKDGKTLEIRDVIPTGVATSAQEAQIVQQNLQVIGVKLTIDTVPSAGFFKDFVNVGNFDITHFAWLGTPFPVSSSGSIYGKYADVQQNYGRIGDTSINDLFTQANQELDPAKKIDLANQIDKAIWDEGFSLLLYQRPQNHAVRSTVANFGSPGFGDVDYTKIGFTKS